MFEVDFYEDIRGRQPVREIKKTQKTPVVEIDRARRYMNDFVERNG